MKRLNWLASYPKSGNTWIRLALSSLRHGGEAVNINSFVIGEDMTASSRNAFETALDIESTDLSEAEILAARPSAFRVMAAALPSPVVWKVHEAYVDASPGGEPLFPADVTAGAVYLVRDPRDVAVSYAHHRACEIDLIIADMASREHRLASQRGRAVDQLPQLLLDWSGHVESWLDRPAFPVTVIRYEDILANPTGALRRIAAALGVDVAEDSVDGAVAATRFPVLQSQEARTPFVEKAPRALTFFRSGRSGDWRTALTPGQADRIVADHGRVMARLGYL